MRSEGSWDLALKTVRHIHQIEGEGAAAMAKIIGIDLGTTNSLGGGVEGGETAGPPRPRLLPRLPAAGDEGRGDDRRTRGAPDHQRAHRGGAGVRPRPAEERADRRLRLGRGPGA